MEVLFVAVSRIRQVASTVSMGRQTVWAAARAPRADVMFTALPTSGTSCCHLMQLGALLYLAMFPSIYKLSTF